MDTTFTPPQTRRSEPGPVRLNLGCGHVCPRGWVNVDGSNRAWLASKWPWLDRLLTRCRLIPPTEFSAETVHADLTGRFRWEDDSVDAVYLGEILEHFTQDDGRAVLAECMRVLKPGGVVRVRVPDNARYWSHYLKAYEQVAAKPAEQWDAEHAVWVKKFFRDVCIERPKRHQSMGHFHKWLYDEVSLVCLMRELGFADAKRMTLHDSRIDDIESVEAREDLIVEAIKPIDGSIAMPAPAADAGTDAGTDATSCAA